MMANRFQDYVEEVNIAVVDEGVLDYQPRSSTKIKASEKETPIPVVHIPRKPHPNGLEVFFSGNWCRSSLKAQDTSVYFRFMCTLGTQ